MKELKVGILSAKHIEMVLCGQYMLDGEPVTGAVSLSAANVRTDLLFTPTEADCYAEVKDVTIGVKFHWERKEDQKFVGKILITKHGGELVLINILDVERYLESVISSEMSATSQIELLKAHAVISRSWVLAQITNRETKGERKPACDFADDYSGLVPRRIRWYGHDDHDLFDVCADDHCQRYQGITRQSTDAVLEAVGATAGEVLTYDGHICDARFSKCCGGVFEQFEYCWEDEHKPYLIVKSDTPDEDNYPDLTDEETAHKWILSAPEAFCNTRDQRVLRQVLNNYDQETSDFYRWTVEYDADTLAELVARKSGLDFGRIIDMIPLERGTSGRISLLRIVGERLTMDIGKELEIRRILSESHLYSSAFVVEKTAGGFRLVGAGWGHGVGLCQIGAAMMADKGYGYRQILQHYYPNSVISNYNE